MDILIKIAQLFLCFTILVGIHELGHFLMARAFKIRVEKFYIFFDPWFSLFKFKRGDTEYGLGWLPLGGYVKIAGMIDESMDKEQMKQPVKPDEFRAKSTAPFATPGETPTFRTRTRNGAIISTRRLTKWASGTATVSCRSTARRSTTSCGYKTTC